MAVRRAVGTMKKDRQSKRLGAGPSGPRPVCLPALSAGLVAVCALAALRVSAQMAEHPPLVVTGAVVEENGAPAAGVIVVLRPHPTVRETRLQDLHGLAALPEAVDEVRSDAEGGFRLGAQAAGPYRLEIWLGDSTGALPVAVPVLGCSLLPLTGPVVLGTVEVPALGRLAIRVENASGEAISGAHVVVAPVGDRALEGDELHAGGRRRPCRPSATRVGTRTDAGGVARFLVPAASRIVVSAPGYAVAVGATKGSRASFRLERDPGTTLRVRDAFGDLVPAAVIAMAEEPGATLGLTDERGEAVVGVGARRGMALEVEAADHSFAKVSARVSGHAGGAAAARLVDVRLEGLAAVPGRVLDTSTGAPIPGAAAWMVSDPGRGTRADPLGVLDVLAPLGGADLEVAASGYVPGAMRVTVADARGGVPVSIGLMAAAPLRGWIVDELGRPVAGADVRAEPSDRGPFPELGAGGSGRALSDAEGSFWVASAVYGSPYRLTATARGYASSVLELAALDRFAEVAPVQIVLATGRQPWGTVVDGAGSPVAGAGVRLLWPVETALLEESALAVDAAEEVVSNARGEFEFRHVAPGPYGVRVSHSEFVDLRWKGVNVPSGEGYADLGVFALTPGAEIRGLVVGPGSRPIAGAEIAVRQNARVLAGQTRSASSGADGSFRLRGLLPVLADLSVTADGYAPMGIESVRPSTGETILIELSAGASVAGTVREPAGGAAAGSNVTLRVSGMASSLLPIESLSRRVRTDGDGGFRLDDLMPGRWLVTVADEAGATATERVEVAAGESREVELQLRHGDRLTVMVRNRLDQPVARARIRVRPERAGSRSAFGSTDASGRVDLQIEAGAATVEASRPGLLAASREVVLGRGSNEVQVRLDPGWEISGVVRTVDGAPISGATVEAGRDPGLDEDGELAARLLAYSRLAESTPRAVSGLDGGFRLTGLDNGRYHLTAGLSGYSSHGAAAPVEIDDRSVAGALIEMTPEAAVRGVVTGVEASDMATVEVRAWQGALYRSSSPDADGAFALDALTAGDWRLVATIGDRRSAESTVSLDSGDMGGFVELRFDRGFRLTGQVLVAGMPLAGGFVRVGAPGETARRSRTDRWGRFEFDGLPAGKYRLRIRHESGVAEERSLEMQSDFHDLRIELPQAEAPGR